MTRGWVPVAPISSGGHVDHAIKEQRMADRNTPRTKDSESYRRNQIENDQGMVEGGDDGGTREEAKERATGG